MKKLRPFPKGTRQYLTFVGPRGARIHPIVRSESTSFTAARLPRLIAVGGRSGQSHLYSKAVS